MSEFNASQTIDKLVNALQAVFTKANKTKAVIAVSGGIDSAVSLSLLVKAIGAKNVYPIFLPYKTQDMADAQTVVEWNKISQENITLVQIEPVVNQIAELLKITDQDQVRLGNVMARTRMIAVFDLAKKLDALVCGTENKSEKYLGYFTRFGDGASDIEPITNLYKTQVRAVAEALILPAVFLTKAPSAGLWSEQTDEVELGFSYQEADLVMEQYLDQHKTIEEITGVDPEKVQQIIGRIKAMKFKQEVPYCL
ncbi:MAG: NAD(+) synthase [Candidatus Pacebacteria bacterium]|nr:NAD(+) synthase [Candidatus Paceibacterota bacterium]